MVKKGFSSQIHLLLFLLQLLSLILCFFLYLFTFYKRMNEHCRQCLRCVDQRHICLCGTLPQGLGSHRFEHAVPERHLQHNDIPEARAEYAAGRLPALGSKKTPRQRLSERLRCEAATSLQSRVSISFCCYRHARGPVLGHLCLREGSLMFNDSLGFCCSTAELELPKSEENENGIVAFMLYLCGCFC